MKKNYNLTHKTVSAFFFFFVMVAGIKAQLTVQTFSYTGAIQTFTVPSCVYQMTIEARGASGGFSTGGTGGPGAIMRGVFNTTPGQVLTYLVGQSPGSTTLTSTTYPAGGGGSYVASGATYSTATPMIVAGGGGGGYGVAGVGAPITTSGTGLAPGTNGNGAPSNSCGGGGGGFFSSGGNDQLYNYGGGQGFQQGGAGGLPNNNFGGASYQVGGFGGGAPANWYGSCWVQGGAGGGYSGGSAHISGSPSFPQGQAGGSFNGGTSQVNTASVNVGSGTITFSYTPGSAVTIVSSPTAICAGGSATLTAGGVSTYTWFNGSNSTSVVVAPGATGSFSVAGTNSIGCSTSVAVIVTVSPGLPVLSVNTSTNSTCLGKSVTLTATGALTYTWSNGVVNGMSYTPAVTNQYTVTGQNGCGTTSAVTTITVAPLPVSAISNPTILCSGNAATLTVVAPATGYTWTPSAFPLTGATVAVNPTVSTLYTVVASDGTCAGTTTLNLQVLATPTITVMANSTIICQGQPVNLTASGALSYTWMPGNTTGATTTANPLAPTLFTVAGTNSLGCTSFVTQVIVVNPSPTIAVSPSSTLICPGQSVSITASGADTYTWNNGNIGPNVVVSPSVSVTYSALGSYSNTGCTGLSAVMIVVFNPSFAVSGTSAICVGGSATLTATGANTYTWQNSSNAQQIVVSPNTTTTYTVAATTTSINTSCNSVNSIQVLVNPKPNVTASSTRTSICRYEKTTLNSSGATNYTWSTGASGSSISVTPTLLTTFNYTVIGIDANGCVNTASIDVKVNPCLDLGENSQARSLVIFPNPSRDGFMVEAGGAVSLKIVNGLSQLVGEVQLTELNNFKVKISGLAPGIYLVFGENNGMSACHKVVVTD